MKKQIATGLFFLAALTARVSAADPDKELAAGNAHSDTRTVTVTYIGVTARPVDSALRAQLKLADGVGLTVAFVDAKGPAAADLHEGDVLQKLDDQILINTQQLVALVRMHKAGDTVTLTVIREAKPIQVAIKLSEKQRSETTVTLEGPVHVDLPGVHPADDMALPMPITGGNNKMAMAFDDGTYSANVSTDPEGHKQMVVKDKSGTVVGQGPVDTEEQWNTFAPEVREHLKVMHQMLRGRKS